MAKNKEKQTRKKFQKSLPPGTLFTKDDLDTFIKKNNITLFEEQIKKIHEKFKYRKRIKIAELEERLKKGVPISDYRELTHIAEKKMTTKFRNLFLKKHPAWEKSTKKENISDPVC